LFFNTMIWFSALRLSDLSGLSDLTGLSAHFFGFYRQHPEYARRKRIGRGGPSCLPLPRKGQVGNLLVFIPAPIFVIPAKAGIQPSIFLKLRFYGNKPWRSWRLSHCVRRFLIRYFFNTHRLLYTSPLGGGLLRFWRFWPFLRRHGAQSSNLIPT